MTRGTPTSLWSRATIFAFVELLTLGLCVVLCVVESPLGPATAETWTVRKVAGAIALVFIGLPILLGSAATAPDEDAEESASEKWRAGTAQTLIYLVWVLAVVLFTILLVGSGGLCSLLEHPLVLLVIFMCSVPALVMLIAARLIRRFKSGNEFQISLPTSAENNALTATTRDPNKLTERLWNYEQEGATASHARIHQHALLFGVFVSVTLMTCTKLAWNDQAHVIRPEDSDLARIAISVASATCFAFIYGATGIFLRAAQDDASARMFARVAQEVVIAQLTTILACGFLHAQIDKQLNAVLMGCTAAVLGRTAFIAMRDRAATFLGLTSRPRLTEDYPLTAIEGITDDECVRLGEEGIGNLHSLAIAPTARIFFNTRFSLQRICDWQDQALLVQYMGPKLAAKLKEHYRVRGVLDAQLIAMTLFRVPLDGAEHSPRKEIREELEKIFADGAPERKELVKNLGFQTNEQVLVSFQTLLRDEVIDRLRVFWHASVEMDGKVPALPSSTAQFVENALSAVEKLTNEKGKQQS